MPYQRYADFSGRSRRREYWMFQLFMLLVVVVIVSAALAFGGSLDEPGPATFVVLALAGLFVLGSIVPSIAVTVRRFHDQDKSGWLYLLSFIPYVGGLIVFVFMCLGGTQGGNRFGPDPKNEGFEAGIFN